MPEHTRQLAAIMFTDIEGYTALMQQDEKKGIETRKRHREVFNRITGKYRGKILQYYGDGTLSIFGSAIDAVECGIEMQLEFLIDPKVPVRIGIHTGDVVFSEDDIIGDGVNVASRVESLAISGAVFISDKVYDEIKNQPKLQTLSMGYFEFKNVERPMEIYALANPGLTVPEREQIRGKTKITAQKKTSPGEGDSKIIIKTGVVMLGILLVGYLLYLFGPTINEILQRAIKTELTGVQVLDKSIAVLPFENLSADEENQYFADGQTEAILNHLTKIAELRVISRTTMMGYSGTTKSVPEIAQELGVRYVLGGSVQKSGQKVRINAQLIDSDLDKHLWSENFDRELTDIFAIQTEIAQSVAQELRATITSREQTIIESVPTSDLTAYDFYLKGMDYQWRSRGQEDYRYAVQMFEQAVEIDPNFTLAWVGLASASRQIYWFHYDRSDEHLAQTKQYLDKAIALDPDLIEVQIETGKYYYHCQLNYPKALQILEKLKSDYPKNDQLHLWAGAVYRRMGQFQKAFEYMDRAISLNPSNWEHWYDAGGTLTVQGRYTQAEDYLKTGIDLNPSAAYSYLQLALVHLATGEVDKARVLLVNNQNIDHPLMYMLRSNAELMDRNYQEAISILESSPHKVMATPYVYTTKPLQLGLIYYVMSNRELANAYFQEARQVLEDKLSESPDDSRLYSSLGIVYAGLGKTEEAMAANHKALAIINISVDAWRGFFRELDMARILLMIGDYGEAIAKLEFLLQQNRFISVELLRKDPFWDPLRELDAFKALIENPKYQINLENN